ncbi:MAG TPA: class IV adenylate cyclase [Candidatus Dormibacteraeota bacterium]|nr:class IV adenylate cyclase [Candidatus Dormibacteraeota bacterium]
MPPETEVEVSDTHATLDLLTQLGFRVEFTYNKHRAMWTLDGVVTVTLDTLDSGWFVELEGTLEVLPEQARSLGLDPATALKDSYSVLARKHLAETAHRPSPRPSPLIPSRPRPLCGRGRPPHMAGRPGGRESS